MPKIIVHTPQFKSQQGLIVSAELQVNALNFFNYYKPYPYFAPFVSENPVAKLRTTFDYLIAYEHLTRARRVVLFSDLTKLKPVRSNKVQFGAISDKVHKIGNCDHVSFWISPRGNKFILNEPYNVASDYFCKLADNGLTAIKLSNDISPYCGRWDASPFSKPWTASYLICKTANEDELDEIQQRLMSQPTPSWNNLIGVYYV